MPWTIYRHILWDLLKLLTMATVVLVTVISFAAALKPLSDGLLSAASLVKFIGYTWPTMLAFVLPFAGAFASTLVFLRLASDNEVTAMAASGMSYVSILVPVFVLGLVLTMGLFYLSNFVIPSFYRAAAKTVQSDLISVLVSRLDGDRPFKLHDQYVLYADSAAQRPLTPAERATYDSETPPSQLVLLKGVAVGRLDAKGRVRDDMTAQRATVVVFRGSGRAWVNIGLQSVMQYDPLDGFVYARRTQLGPISLPSPLKDNPKYLSWPALRALRRHPDRYGEVAELKGKLAGAVAAEKLRHLLAGALAGPGPTGRVVLAGQRGNTRYALQAPRVRRRNNQLLLRGTARRPVVVDVLRGGRRSRRYESSSATLLVDPGKGNDQPSVLVWLADARVFQSGRPRPATERKSLELPRMSWSGRVLNEKVNQRNAFDMLRFAGRPPFRSAASVRHAGNMLWREIRKLGRRVKGQLHQRAASAVACLLLLTLGATLSMKLKEQMSLVVYFWSFALAVVTVIIIHTGANLTGSLKFPLVEGLSILWLGNVMLALVTAVVYCRLARN